MTDTVARYPTGTASNVHVHRLSSYIGSIVIRSIVKITNYEVLTPVEFLLYSQKVNGTHLHRN